MPPLEEIDEDCEDCDSDREDGGGREELEDYKDDSMVLEGMEAAERAALEPDGGSIDLRL